jgi:tetratricopeptide (TPR) repeat protein
MFPRVYPPELVYYQGRGFFVDRAHNLFLDWAVMAGLPGALAFALFFFLFVIVVMQALRRPQPPQKRALLVAVLAAVLGNTVNNLASFDVTPTAAAVWLLMGTGVALSAPLPLPVETALGRQPVWRWALAGLLFVLIGAAVWQANGRPLAADAAARAAYRRGQAGEWDEAAAAAEQAVAYWPVEPAHYLLLSQMYWRQAAADPSAAAARLRQAEAALLAARQMRPEDPILWLRTAEFYTAVTGQSDRETRRLADAAYQQAIALAPNNAAIYAAWGRALLAENDPERAAPLLRQAVRLDQSEGEAYIYLGVAELALGRVEIALADYQEAVRLLPGSSRAYTGLARAYWQLGRPEEALQAAEMALQQDSQNGEAFRFRQQIVDSFLD